MRCPFHNKRAPGFYAITGQAMKDNQWGNENPPPQCLLCGNIAFILTDCGVKCNRAPENTEKKFGLVLNEGFAEIPR